MEKRVLLAIFLSFLVLYAYQAFFVKTVPTSRAGRPEKRDPTERESSAPNRNPAAAAQTALPEAGLAASLPEATVADIEERQIVVNTSRVRAVFSNRGARLISWQLKQFVDEARRPVDLVPANVPPGFPRPFTLATDNAGITRVLGEALFKPDPAPGWAMDATKVPTTLKFDYEDVTGLRVHKAFRFEPHSYVVSFSASVMTSAGVLNPTVRWGPGLGDVATTRDSSTYFQKPQGMLFREREVDRLSASDLTKQAVYEGPLRFAGVDDHYFLAGALSPGGKMRVEYQPTPIPVPGSTTGATRHFVAYSVRFTDGVSAVKFFIGPKDFDVLASVDRELVRAINFGWFSFLVVPLLRSLKWVNGYVGNYGWAIIILTVLINAAMFPLRHKSVVSMRKMQELQPEIKTIQDRYAKLKTTDPARQKMQVEMMALYRERGVNPAAGCVPMLLTMPVLFAFYSLLSTAIEIRGAPFILWIKDLSAHDPLYVTPILMGGTMVWQQKMTPTSADPTQQKIMMIMPLVFTGMFLWAPSGLVLYWLVSNIWAIGQQHITNWLIGPPVVRAPRPPAERLLKKVPGGRTEPEGAQKHA